MAGAHGGGHRGLRAAAVPQHLAARARGAGRRVRRELRRAAGLGAGGLLRPHRLRRDRAGAVPAAAGRADPDPAPRLHRVNGRIVALSILPAGLGGLVLAPSNQAGLIGTAGFGLLAVLWIGFVGAAVRAARRRHFAAHRRWAVRTFAMTYAAVTLRLWLGVLTPVLAGFGMDPEAAFELAYHLVPFLCWVPNLLLAEWLLRRPTVPVVSRTGGAGA
ncbi:DUF2306 domain-containing protein [Catellatospora bangladeshensis]|uniref:DUF2306 domain-containing protein n=1 Tax=Catellatospora bangladeshensis TaxID=310355 RepID=UPI00361097AA